jgi:uncharacterized protein YjbI with pentapeptide repeats
MRVAALLSTLRKHDLSSVQLGAAKLGEVVMVYVIFSGADFFRIIFTE